MVKHTDEIGRQHRPKIGKILKEMGHITAEDLDWALHRMKRRLGKILIELGIISDQKLQQALALQTEALKDTQ